MAEVRKITRITDTFSALSASMASAQIGITTDNILTSAGGSASSLGFKALSWKDTAGNLLAGVAMDQDASLKDVRIDTLAIGNAVTFDDNAFTLQDNGDNTKKFKFECSTVSAGATRTMTVPDANVTLAATTWQQDMTTNSFNLSIPDNTTSALVIEEGANAYMAFNTSNGNERIHIYKSVEISGNLDLTPLGAAVISVNDNTAIGVMFYAGGAPMLGICTSNGEEFTYHPHPLMIKARASSLTPYSTYGQLWTKTSGGSAGLWYTDISGTDTQIV